MTTATFELILSNEVSNNFVRDFSVPDKSTADRDRFGACIPHCGKY